MAKVKIRWIQYSLNDSLEEANVKLAAKQQKSHKKYVVMYFDQSPAAELANPNLFSFAFGPRYQRQSYRLVVRLKE